MREIDDRYPEYAEPYEPVKKAKHYKGLSWKILSFPFFTVAAVFVSSLFVLNAPPSSPKKVPVKPEEPEGVIVTISAANYEEEYSGEEYVITPEYSYVALAGSKDVSSDVSVALTEDLSIAATEVGTYPFGLSASSFIVSSDKYEDIRVTVNDGYLKINPVNITVTITGNKLVKEYDRKAHTVTGYKVTISDERYTEEDMTFLGSDTLTRTDVGKEYMGLSSASFINNNTNYDVTFDVTDGYIEIEKAEVTVKITGNSSTVDYNGSAHSVSGYSVEIDNGNYTESLFRFSGTASATRTSAGTTYMGLNASQFRNLDSNFSVTFDVTDGYITINRTNEPTLSGLDVYDNLILDTDEFALISIKMMPNGIAPEGGKAIARVYVKNEDGIFEADDEYPFEYEGDGDSSEVEVVVEHRFPDGGDWLRERGKLVIEYTYPDGSTGTWESEEFYMYRGTFAYTNWDFGEYGILLNGNKIEVDLIFEQTVEFDDGGTMTISPDNVEIVSANVYTLVYDGTDFMDDMSVDKDMPDTVTFLTDDEGIMHMHLTYVFDINVDPGAPYEIWSNFSAEFHDKASGWDAGVW